MAGSKDDSEQVRGILCIGDYGRLIELNKSKSEKEL